MITHNNDIARLADRIVRIEDARAIFDVSMRMLMHITNDFQREWSPRIDEPMTRALKDEIINREQEKLDGYVSMGALLGEPQIVFLLSLIHICRRS